jgi:hypothetical protein
VADWPEEHVVARDSAVGHQVLRNLAVRARTNAVAFNQFVLRDESTGKRITNAPQHVAWHGLLDKHERLLILAAIESGKHLAVDTPVPTPGGWRTMGDLAAGDVVFGRNGRACRVTWAGPVELDHVTYRLTFDDGASIVASDEHRWVARNLADVGRLSSEKTGRVQRPRRTDPSKLKRPPSQAFLDGLAASAARRKAASRAELSEDGWRVVTTQEMIDAGLTRRSGAKRADGSRYDLYNWRIPLTAPVEYPARAYLVPPYVLGVWLGNGSVGKATVTFNGEDRAVADRCHELLGLPPVSVWPYDKRGSNAVTVTIGGGRRGVRALGLRDKLRQVGVLEDKHVPADYLIGSVEQRRDLLAGLLDTDGSAAGARVEFSSTTQRLAVSVLELARSLGIKATIATERATLNGQDMGPNWRVCFTSHDPVFWSPRKRAMHETGEVSARGARVTYRCVVAIDRVDTVPMRCIAVDPEASPDCTYVAGRDYIVTHNTVQMSVGRTLWNLGRNPNRRVVIVTKTSQLAQKIVRSIGQYIQQSDELHEVFPNLVRSKDVRMPFNLHQLTVERTVFAKDPSVQATGIFGNIHGARIDDLILDDVLDSENTRTQTPRDHLWNWVQATLMGRLTGSARVVVLSNAWHPDDLVHRLSKKPGFALYRFPVYDEQGVVAWPERWTPKRIEQKRMDMGPFEFARALLCQARDDESLRFKREWVDACCARGEGLRPCHSAGDLFDELLERHPDWADQQLAAESARLLGDHAEGPLDRIGIYTGVDLAFSKKAAADLSCIFTIAVMPNGDRRVLEVEAGRWTSPDTIAKVESAAERFGSIVMVESVGAQLGMLDMLSRRSAITVVPYRTGSGVNPSLEFVVEAVAVEMMNKKWIIPTGHDGKQRDRETSEWLSNLFSYDPAAHTPDRIAAMCFARQCAIQHAIQAGSVGARVISPD